jgi:hypothetical protein
MLTAKKIVATSFVAILLSGLFPPWNSVVDNKVTHLEESIGYYPIFDPPAAYTINRMYASAKIDFARLGLQWILIICAGGTALYFRRSN